MPTGSSHKYPSPDTSDQAPTNDQNDGSIRSRVSIREVARHAGVSLSSVSRVLNGHPNITPKLRKQVEDAVQTLGYQVNLVGAGLRRGTTRTVGFLINDIANTLFAEIMLGAEAALSEAGYLVTLISSQNGDDETAITLFRNRRVDGLLAALSDDTRPDIHRLIAASSSDCPTVLLDRDMPMACSRVLTDHQHALDEAVDELAGAGHRNIALLTGSLRTRPGRERMRAIRSALARHGLRIREDSLIAHDAPTALAGEASMRALLRRRKGAAPTAVIVGGGQLQVGVLKALRDEGVQVGEGMSIITLDDTPLVELHSPPITAIRRDVVAIGRKAAELLLKAMVDKDGAPGTIVMPVELIRRDSVKRLRADS